VARTKFRAIIFDIGRVLIRVDVSRAMSGLAGGLALNPQEVWSAIEKDPLWMDWQEGRISPQDWHLHLSKRLGASLSFEQFTEIWNRALAPEPIQPEALLEKLSKNCQLALLSNTDPIHMSHAETHFPFFRFFSVRIYSFHVGASKPDPLIYREALRACKVRAEEAVYIDDVAAYVQAAQRLGMAGVVFQAPEQLKQELRALGVNPD
jgi:HAD superfamily hydrolase (TIGR01509 family)